MTFFLSDKGLASVYLWDYPQYVQRLILLSVTHGSQSASLELLLSGHCFTCTHDSMLPAIKHQLPAGPMCPSSHNLPWLSKPLICPIYSLTADHHKPQGIHLHPHGPCVTLVLPFASPSRNAHSYPLRNTVITFSWSLCNTRVTTHDQQPTGKEKSGQMRNWSAHSTIILVWG